MGLVSFFVMDMSVDVATSIYRARQKFSTVSTPVIGQLPISIDCVFDASLVPRTCLRRFLDLKGLINKFLESGIRKVGSWNLSQKSLADCRETAFTRSRRERPAGLFSNFG